MGIVMKNMALCFLLLLWGILVPSAKTMPNIQNLEQSYASVVPAQETDSTLEIYPVLLVEFEDVKFSLPDPKRQFNEYFNGKGYAHNGATGSVAEYLDANFRGKALFGFDVSDVISLKNPIAVYGAHGTAFNDVDVLQLVKDACAEAVVLGMDFARYDNDNDGKVDNVAIVFAGYSEAEGGGDNAIWPHQKFPAGRELAGDVPEIFSYTCTAELSGAKDTVISAIGTFCHEFAHYLGLPDLYDANGAEEGEAPALYGPLSIMDKGNFLNMGRTPPYFNAVERELLGLCGVEDLLPDRHYTIRPVQDTDVLYRINTSNEGEYFLLECRDAEGWDAYIGGSGLVVYHIDKSEKVYGGISCSDRWQFNNLNCYSPHECVRVVSASGCGAAVPNLFYPGGADVLQLVSWQGEMPLKDWGGHSVGIGIVDISFSGGAVSFRTVSDYAFDKDLPAVNGCRVCGYQKDIKIEWSAPLADEGGGEDLEWLVKWRLVGNTGRFMSAHTDTAGFWIEGINPGVEYEIQVSVLDGNRYGSPAELKAKSIPVTSIYPYIHVRAGGYSKGDVMDLRVINLVEEHISVSWHVNGNPVHGNSFRFEEEGETAVMATIKYNDGSEEKIYKNIDVR